MSVAETIEALAAEFERIEEVLIAALAAHDSASEARAEADKRAEEAKRLPGLVLLGEISQVDADAEREAVEAEVAQATAGLEGAQLALDLVEARYADAGRALHSAKVEAARASVEDAKGRRAEVSAILAGLDQEVAAAEETLEDVRDDAPVLTRAEREAAVARAKQGNELVAWFVSNGDSRRVNELPRRRRAEALAKLDEKRQRLRQESAAAAAAQGVQEQAFVRVRA